MPEINGKKIALNRNFILEHEEIHKFSCTNTKKSEIRAIKLLCAIPNKLDEEIIRILSVPLSLEFVKFYGEDFLDVEYLEIRAMEDYHGDHTIFYFPQEKRNFNTYINVRQRNVILNVIRSSEFCTRVSITRNNETYNCKECKQIYRYNNNKRSN